MTPTPATLSFEQALAELEKILRGLEDGTTTLDAALGFYERGVVLLNHCHGQLRSAEQRIRALTGLDENGEPQLQPFAHAPSMDPVPRKRPSRTSIRDEF